MTVTRCPRCRVWEGGYGPPSTCVPDEFSVYVALSDYYSQDPMILEDSSDTVAHNLVRKGFLNHAPHMADVESCLDIVRQAECL
jgi:hypothetical protein